MDILQHVARQVRWKAVGGGGCHVTAPCDCGGADGFGKHEIFTLRYSDANTDRGRRRKEVRCNVGTAVLEPCVFVSPDFLICATPACILSLHYC
jgi:hypothetical protein